MKVFLRVAALWIAMAGISWLLLQKDIVSVMGVILPALAVWLTGRVVVVLPARRLWRWGFWAITCAGWIAAVLLAEGRFESAVTEEGRQAVLLTVLCATVLPALAAWRTRTFPTWRTVGDAAAGTAIVILACAAFVRAYDSRTSAMAVAAEGKWADIGLSLGEYEKALSPGQENAGSQELRAVLSELLGTGIYKQGTAAAAAERLPASKAPTDDLLARASAILGERLPAKDDVELTEAATSELDAHAAFLDEAYAQILSSEAPAWAYDPANGPDSSAPNFLGLRKFAQVASADAMRRFAIGDYEGASRAVAAGLRTSDKLLDCPGVAPLGIRVAMQSLFSQAQVRLPATENGFEAIDRDALAFRRALTRALRHEAWFILRHGEKMAASDYAIRCDFLPVWLQRSASRRLTLRECALGALAMAEHVVIQKAPGTEALADLGSEDHENVSRQYRSFYDLDVGRLAMRVHAMLLLREQSELIREARACMAEGRPLVSRDSGVLPGVRWELTADWVHNTVSTRLVNPPFWVAGNFVTGPEFWLLPLNGSRGWALHPVVRAVALAR